MNKRLYQMIELSKKIIFIKLLRNLRFLVFLEFLVTWLKLHCAFDEKIRRS